MVSTTTRPVLSGGGGHHGIDLDCVSEEMCIRDSNYSKSNDVKLDLGGIAKGYVTELVGRYLEENDIHSYIINAGGNVMVGKAYNKDTFLVGITSPDNKDDMFTKVKVNNLSIVTSGSYQRYCTLDGINYNHIINPITKYPSNYMKMCIRDRYYLQILVLYLVI